jgi:hypothetical protein
VEIMWPDTVSSSVPALKLHWVAAIPLHAWRKPVDFFIIGKGLGPSTMCSARIRLPGSCCVAARLFLNCHPVPSSGLSGQDIGFSTTRWPRRLCSAKPIHGFVQPSTAVVFLNLFFFDQCTVCLTYTLPHSQGILYSYVPQN